MVLRDNATRDGVLLFYDVNTIHGSFLLPFQDYAWYTPVSIEKMPNSLADAQKASVLKRRLLQCTL